MSNANFNPEVNKISPLVGQFLRFVLVGFINTTINFIVLNFLSYLTGITSGPHVIYLAGISFVVATTNSYYMNKYWAFHDSSHFHEGRQITLFLLVSLVGLAINSGLVYLVTTHVNPMFNLTPKLWLNAAAVVATGISMIWNFIGYRIFVFKQTS